MPEVEQKAVEMLNEPKIAVLTGPPVSVSGYGMIWHMIDYEFGIRMASIDVSNAGRVDLSKYNVLIIPSVWGSANALKSTLDNSGVSNIEKWIKDGGTLIAIGDAATFCTDEKTDISKIKLKRDVLDELDEYEYVLMLERSADNVAIDSMRIWENIEPKAKKSKEEDKKEPSNDEARRADEFAREFSPEGAIFECRIDTTEWLSYGMDEDIPVMMYTDAAYMSKPPIKAVARLQDENKIRLSGLAWPEARERWANTVYCSRESNGKGQVILFSGYPIFRSFFFGSKRLFVNAILLGPGMGARWSGPY